MPRQRDTSQREPVRPAFKLPADSSLLLIDDQSPSYGGTPTVGGELRIGRPNLNPGWFNPAAFAQDFQVAASYLDPLLRPNRLTLEPEPWLATTWTVADEGRLITYNLRDDVTWQDGTPLTADDVAFSFTVYAGDTASAVRNFFTQMEEATASDETTVVVRLMENDPTWLFNASTLPIFQRAQYQDYWQNQTPSLRSLDGFDWRRSKPVGTGPWRIETWDAQSITLERYATYWQQAPWHETLKLVETGTVADALTNWSTGKIDLAWPIRPQDVDRVGDRPGWLYVTESTKVQFVAFNFANDTMPLAGVFADPLVREALNSALDRRAYGDEVYGGFIDADGGGTLVQPWARDSKVKVPAFDPEAAVARLNEAGYYDLDGDGYLDRWDGMPLSLTLVHPTTADPELLRVLARMRLDLMRIGVGLVLVGVPPDEFVRQWTRLREYDLIAFSYNTYPGFSDFDLYGSLWDPTKNISGWNPGSYANAEMDAAIETYLSAVNLEDQQDALREMQRIANEDLFGLWLGFPQTLVLVGAEKLGYLPDRFWPGMETAAIWDSPLTS